MEKAIRVRIMGREFALRVREEDEVLTRQIAGYVDARMQAFKRAHPEQPELTAAVITALAIAEELFSREEEQEEVIEGLDASLAALDRQLASALEDPAEAAYEGAEPPGGDAAEIPDEDLRD